MNITILDINDNAPMWQDEPYNANVVEMSPINTDVITVSPLLSQDKLYLTDYGTKIVMLKNKKTFTHMFATPSQRQERVQLKGHQLAGFRFLQTLK